MIGYGKTRHLTIEEHRIKLPAPAGEVNKVINAMAQRHVTHTGSSIGVAADAITVTVEDDELVLTVQIERADVRTVVRAEYDAYVSEVRRQLQTIVQTADDLLTTHRDLISAGQHDGAILQAAIGRIKDVAIELSNRPVVL
jgi:hypothetical protein